MSAKYFFMLLLGTFSVAAQSPCDLRRDKKGIRIYTCETKNSDLQYVKASFRVKSKLSQLASMVLDIDHLGDWQYETESAKTLKVVNDLELIYHTEINAPVVDNRDFVIRLSIKQDPNSKQLTIDAVSIPQYIPPIEDVVRVPYSKAQWTVTPLDDSMLQVEYYIELDLGGKIPSWVVEPLAPKAPFETFKALMEIIGKYEGKTVLGIRD